MAGSEHSPAKVLLLAVQLASKADIPRLQNLVFQNQKTLHTQLVLRIILTYLPESLESEAYTPFLQDLITGNLEAVSEASIDPKSLEDLTDAEAKKKVRSLNLLPLTWTNGSEASSDDYVTNFLTLRALRVDQSTGFIDQIPNLLYPFLSHSPELRTWMVSTILPLLRLTYEYRPHDGIDLTISQFESLDDRAGVALLLGRAGRDKTDTTYDDTIGRDLRGLVGPWMYGDSRVKRRRLERSPSQNIESLDTSSVNQKVAAWEEVFKWIVNQAGTSWRVAVGASEQWDGPGDVDLGGYEDDLGYLDEEEQQHLERRYARALIASAYLISEDTEEALHGVQRILTRIINLMDKDNIPALQAAAKLLTPVSGLGKISTPKNSTFLRNGLLDKENPLTTPNQESISFLHALLISAFLFTKIGCPMSIRRAGELALLQDYHEQSFDLSKYLLQYARAAPKDDDRYWTRMRNEILWLRSWDDNDQPEGSDANKTRRGVLGSLPKEDVEISILKVLLANSRYALIRSIYENPMDRPLPPRIFHDTVKAIAYDEFDNATNPNKSRGGLKKCNDMIHAFPDTLESSLDINELKNLVRVTDDVGKYRLVLKQGEGFRPVNLRVHKDPISIIGKILDQNSKSYTQIGDFIDMGRNMVKAGLTARDESGVPAKLVQAMDEQQVAEKRVVSMCIDAALAEDDFETAYSFVVTYLKDVAEPAHVRSPDLERGKAGLFAEAPPKIIDDWSWRAALQAGKHRRTAHTIKPTHLGNSAANLNIRHLEQRMDCLSQALRLAPKATLHEILNVYRRCEEELESLVRQEAEQEAAWDAQVDDQLMPGGFAATPMKKNTTPATSRAVEEAPMSLFDLSRASMARAQSGFSALSMIKAKSTTNPAQTRPDSRESFDGSRTSTPDSGAPKAMRKRDQLKNAAVGGLASGVGWLIGAPAATSPTQDEH